MTSLPRTEASTYATKAGQQLLETKSEARPSSPKVAPAHSTKDSFWEELQKASQTERPKKSRALAEPSAASRNAQASLGRVEQQPKTPRKTSLTEEATSSRKLALPEAAGPKRAQAKTTAPGVERNTSTRPSASAKLAAQSSEPVFAPASSSPVTVQASALAGSGTGTEAAPQSIDKGQLLSGDILSMEASPAALTPELIPNEILGLLQGPNFKIETSMDLQGLPSLGIEAPLQDMQNLNFALGGRDQLLQASPALALLSGHIEKIIPTEIPQILSENPLFQEVLASSDLDELFSEPLTLEDALQTLGVGDSPLAAAIAAKNLGSANTTLAETLNALGFDVDRIEKEGLLLQQTLPLEGAQPYMLRSAKLRAQEPREVDQSLAAMAGLMPQMQLSQPQLAQTLPASEIKDLPLISALDGKSLKNSELPLYDLAISEIAEGTAPTSEVFLPTNGLEAANNLPKEDPDLHSSEALRQTLGEPIPTRPQVQLTDIDPFASIDKRMQALDRQILTFSAADLPRTEPADELQVEDFAQLLAPSFSPEGPGRDLKGGLTPNGDAGPSSVQSPETLALSMIEGSIQEGGGKRHDSQGDQSPGTFQGGQGEAGNPFLSSSSAGGSRDINSSFEIQGPASSEQAKGLPQDLARNVFDKASMMLKEGGGSIRLDLGTEGLGSLELALEIKDKMVELRIIASSPQARELLAQDLPKLRDSLMNQNLNLEKVEIGLNQGSSWSQSSGEGHSFRGQSQSQEFFLSSARGPRSRTGEARSYRQITSSNDRRPGAMHSGSIQVRV